MKNHADKRLRARDAVAGFFRTLWYLRTIFAVLLVLFLGLSVAMYWLGGSVNAATRTPSSVGETFYFSAVTALTIGYGDIVPGTALGRVIALALGCVGVVLNGLIVAAAVRGVEDAARAAGLRR